MGKDKKVKQRTIAELRQSKEFGYRPPVNKPLLYDKRRAIDCKLIKRSATHEGYCKYIVTIGERDGTTHQQPVYGKDMQDALSRLLWHERTEKVVKVAEKGNGTPIIALTLLALIIPAIYTAETDNPIYLLWSLGAIVVAYIVMSLWDNYVSKAGKIK